MTKVSDTISGVRAYKNRQLLNASILSNTCYVNRDYMANDINKRIFVSLEAAYKWILIEGSVSATNKWRILCAPGEDVSIVTNPNIYVWDGSMQQSSILLSNTVWVNEDLLADDTERRIFMSYDNAKEWVIANGSLSDTNPWQVMLPGGIIPSVTVIANLNVSGIDGTIIDDLIFDVTYVDMESIKFGYVSTVRVNNLIVPEGKCGGLFNSIVIDATPATGASYLMLANCIVLNGDFDNYVIKQMINTTIIACDNLSYSGKNCYIDKNCNVKSVDQIGGNFRSNTFEDIKLFGVITNNLTFPAGTHELTNCIVNGDVIIEDGARLELSNTPISGSLTIETGGILTNKGAYYDNRNGMIATNIQSAIDELAGSVFNKTINEVGTEISALVSIMAAGVNNVTAGKVLVINGGEANEEEYTFVAALSEPAVAGEILIGTDILETLSNLATVINTESLIITADTDALHVYIRNVIPGSIGDGMGITTDSVELTLSGATLTGGGYHYDIDPIYGKYQRVFLTDTTQLSLIDDPSNRSFEILLEIVQDNAGNHGVTFVSETTNILYTGGVIYSPTATAEAIDLVRLYYNGSEWYVLGVYADIQLGVS